MAFPSSVRKLVDRDLAVLQGRGSILVTLVPWLPLLLFRRSVSTPVETALAVLASALTVAWLAFVAWRALRLVKAASLKGDRHFDTQGKLTLPSEYLATESATRASRRRKRPTGPRMKNWPGRSNGS